MKLNAIVFLGQSIIGFTSDTANVMVGKRNSVLSRFINKQPFSLGCLYHLAALYASAAMKKLSLSVDNLLIDIFYHFKHSAKRYHEFSEIQANFLI